MSDKAKHVCEYVSGALAESADPEKADGMQAYMKTDMPFYGVQKAGRVPIVRYVMREFPPSDRAEYESIVLALWMLPHREEKYIAQAYARNPEFLTPESFPLLRRMIVEGAWWDFVDEVATHMVREVIRDHPAEAWQVIDRWIDDEDMWLRRTAILCQIGLKEATDTRRLFSFCSSRMHEKEFFIRKAIGWALREYAKTDPDAVAAFAVRNRDQLSGLSFREATKHIKELIDQ